MNNVSISAKLKKMKKKNLISKLRKVLEKEPIEFAYLFGSQATGEAWKSSDIDIAVYFKKEATKDILGKKLHLCSVLENLLKREVDVVYLNKIDLIPPHLGYDILKEGWLILEKNPELRQKIEKRLLEKYREEAPLAERRWQKMFAQIRAMQI